MVVEAMSVKRSAHDTASYSGHSSRGRQATLQCYSSQAKVGRQSLLMESNEALCDSAIAQMIHRLNLSLSFASDPLFQAVLNTARTVGSQYRPPDRVIIGGALLDANYNTVRASNEKKLTQNSDITGLQAMGDGATIRKMPLFNVLASTHGTPPVVLAVHDCSKHLAHGGKKDAEYVARIFMPQMLKVDPKKDKFDLYIVDGASNVQSAGDVVAAYFPCVTTVHGSEHGISLVFADIAKLPAIKVSSSCSLFCHIPLHR